MKRDPGAWICGGLFWQQRCRHLCLADCGTHRVLLGTAWGKTAGFLAGFGWAAMGIAIVSLFERKSWSYLLINGGYLTVALTLMGTILGAWR